MGFVWYVANDVVLIGQKSVKKWLKIDQNWSHTIETGCKFEKT
jgi:hypothetical protein